MIKQYRGADRALTYLFEHANEIELTPILLSGTISATLSIDGTNINIYSAGSPYEDKQYKKTLTVGSTSLVFTSINPVISQGGTREFATDLSDMLLDIYVDNVQSAIKGVIPTSITIEGIYTDSGQVQHEDGRITLVFPSQVSDVDVTINLKKAVIT